MDAAAIEQMNKVRVSLGMAPLPVLGKDAGPQFKEADDSGSESDELSTLDKRQALADSNWQKLEAERKEKLEREKRKAAAKKARDAAARFAKLEGKGLGDEDEDEVDTRAWLLGQKKRQKAIEKARKLEEELAERERQAQLQEYTSKDLAGVKVGHEANAFDDANDEQVLTLKDTAIGEESEDDELENAELKAKEKLEEKLRLKKKRPDYDPTDQEEARNVLSKYDDEIDGKKQKRFTLDGLGNTVEATKRRLDADGEVKSKGVKISLDMLKDDAPVSDYVDPSTIKVKKPKKKKEKKTRQKAVEEDDVIPPAASPKPEMNAMDVDGVQTNGTSKKRALDLDVDDEDLQVKLAESRRQALKKRKRMDAAELARQMRDEMPLDEEGDEDGGMIMDETSEFVANLKKPEVPEARERTSKTPQHATVNSPEEDEDGDTTMAQSYAEAADEEERQERMKRESSATQGTPNITTTGLDDEDTISGAGTGAALAMLRKRGLIADPAAGDLSARERQRAQFLANKQHLIDDYDNRAKQQREADRRSGRWDRMSNRERDTYARQQNEAREAYIAKLLADMFNKEYRPDVKLEYHDEFGREMNAKEAFKHMSHMFHGKGSGKQKTEKRLKKIEDEKRGEAKGVLHAGGEGGFGEVAGREGRRQKQAGVRLQ
jgi:U4/U6.U5 tri-snRNP-associated protein 1